MNEESILPSFLCPITQSCMKDPVSLETGHTYERKAIDTWFNTNSTDPNTNMYIGKKRTTNYALKNAIGDMVSASLAKYIHQIFLRNSDDDSLYANMVPIVGLS
jgi:hypothetical protein